jgi:hypothetical protein
MPDSDIARENRSASIADMRLRDVARGWRSAMGRQGMR